MGNFRSQKYPSIKWRIRRFQKKWFTVCHITSEIKKFLAPSIACKWLQQVYSMVNDDSCDARHPHNEVINYTIQSSVCVRRGHKNHSNARIDQIIKHNARHTELNYWELQNLTWL
jgi:hypothetical protein